MARERLSQGILTQKLWEDPDILRIPNEGIPFHILQGDHGFSLKGFLRSSHQIEVIKCSIPIERTQFSTFPQMIGYVEKVVKDTSESESLEGKSSVRHALVRIEYKGKSLSVRAWRDRQRESKKGAQTSTSEIRVNRKRNLTSEMLSKSTKKQLPSEEPVVVPIQEHELKTPPKEHNEEVIRNIIDPIIGNDEFFSLSPLGPMTPCPEFENNIDFEQHLKSFFESLDPNFPPPLIT